MEISDYSDMVDESSSTGKDSFRILDINGKIQAGQKVIDVDARKLHHDNSSHTNCKISDTERYHVLQMYNSSNQRQSHSDLRNIQRNNSGSNILKEIKDCSRSQCEKYVKDFVDIINFSDNLLNRLGKENNINIYGIPTSMELSLVILDCLINYETLNNKDDEYISALLNINSKDDGIYGSGNFDKDGNFSGRINENGHDNIISYTQDFIGPSATSTDALIFLLNLLKIDAKKIFKMSLDRHACSLRRQCSNYTNNIPNYYIALSLFSKHKYISVDKVCSIKGSDGNVLSAYVCCSMGDTKFILPATMSQGTLSIGKVKASCYPFNLDKLLHNPNATAVLFCNPFDAIAYQDILDETRAYKPSDFVVTNFLGNDPSVWITSALDNRNVVIVPPLEKVGLAYAYAYELWLRDHAKQVRYHCGFILHHKPEIVETEDKLSEAEECIVSSVTFIADIESPAKYMTRIIARACLLNEYYKWGVSCGIFKRKKNHTPSNTDHTEQKLAALPEMNEPPASALNNIRTSHLFRPGTLSLVEGDKDSGKTRLVYHICSSILHSSDLFSFIPSTNSRCKILYIDIETPGVNIDVMKKSYDINDESKFKVLYSLDQNIDEYPSFCKNFTLQDEIFRNGLRNYILNEEYRYLIIDHATGFLDDWINYDHQCGIIYDWIQSLLKSNVSVIMIHHLNTEGNKSAAKAVESGSKKFRKHAHTILHLISINEILESNEVPEPVRSMASKPGNTFGINFKVCKLAPILSGYTLWIHQDYDDASFKKMSLTDRSNYEVNIDTQQLTENKSSTRDDEDRFVQTTYVNLLSKKDASECTDTIKHNLTAGEQRIIDYIKQNVSISTHKAQELLGCNNRETTRKRLDEMCTKGIIKHNGMKNRDSAYILPD